MSEVMFVLKSLAITAVLTMAMQLQMSGVPLERKIARSLEDSPVVEWVQSAAAGGALMIQRSAEYAVSKTKDVFSGGESPSSRAQRAGR